MSALRLLAEVAAELRCSERHLRALARRLGACRLIGKTMLLTETDIHAILEASRPCPSRSTSAEMSGITGAQLPEGDYEALRARVTKQLRSASPQKERRPRGKVILMARPQS